MAALAGVLTGLDFWAWWIFAAVLLAVEMLAPGVLFLWLAIAAGVVGVLMLLFDLAWQVQYLAFAVLSAVSVLAGRWWLARHPGTTERPGLNRRAEQLVGEVAVLSEPIVNGRGRIRLGDSSWLVHGPDLPAGSRVQVVDSDGTILHVRPVPAP